MPPWRARRSPTWSSMYSLIYKNTGGANQAIFESSQGRFKGGYWDNMEAYIRNSPVYHATNVKTPLMILHNDKDGAVDQTQGIEYFNTLRRMGKPVILLEYKGENHGLRQARESEGLHRPHARVFRSLPDGQARAEMDGRRRPPPQDERSSGGGQQGYQEPELEAPAATIAPGIVPR